jgi:hypothetical protein
MAVDTELVQESVPIAPAARRSAPRLHDEILPPELEASTPVAVRSAHRALAITAVAMIVVQFISAPIGHHLNSIARSGTDAYSEWQRYASGPVPDVLIIGASPARTDVDEPALSTELSSAAGRRVTVEKLGFAGQTPQFLEALMYRIMKRDLHPRLIVVAFAGPELSEGCTDCSASLTNGLIEISDLTDPGFISLAADLDPNPARLFAGWLLPSLAYYPSVIALQCVGFEAGRAASRFVLGRLPGQLQNPTYCESTAAYKWARQQTMTQSDYQSSINQYGGFMLDFRMSQTTESSIASIVERGRAGGANVVFFQTPLHPAIRALFSEHVQSTRQHLLDLASNLNTGVVDLSDAVPDDPSLWIDGVHLDRAGADYIQPALAARLLVYLG